MKFFPVAVAGAFLFASTMASAVPQTGAAASQGVAVGAKVYDPAGAEVGSIESVTGDVAVVSTGTSKGSLPKSAFQAGEKGLTIAMTKADLDAAVQKATADASAQLNAKITAGAKVTGATGAQIGTVKESDGQFVTLSRPNGDVRLPVSAFADSPTGLMLRISPEELDAAVAKAKSSAQMDTGAAPQP